MKQTKKTTDIQEEINIIIIVVNFIFQSKQSEYADEACCTHGGVSLSESI